jgi:hypothetical protein
VQDEYGSTARHSQTVEVRPLPEPEFWHLVNLDASTPGVYDSEETWLRLHAQSFEPTDVTVVRYDSVFVADDSVTLSAPQLWSLTVLDRQAVSYPLYLEVPIRRLGEVPPNTVVYTWRGGGWKACTWSGASGDRVWAYLSEEELGEGLIALGLSDGYVRVSLRGVNPSNEPEGYVCKVDLTSVGYAGDYRVHLRLGERLASIETVPLTRGGTVSLEMGFRAQQGTHVVSVNGVDAGLRVTSPLNSLFIVGLGLIPVSLISVIIKRGL